MGDALAVDKVVVVGIYHRGVAVGGHAQESVEGSLAQFQTDGSRLKEHVVCLSILGDGHQGVAAGEVVDGQRNTFPKGVVILSREWSRREQEYILNGFASAQLRYGLGCATGVVAGQETVYFFSHEGLLMNYCRANFVIFSESTK